jgi:hypothetical protein
MGEAVAAGEIQLENRPLRDRSDEGAGSAPAGTLHGVEALMRLMAAQLLDKVPQT